MKILLFTLEYPPFKGGVAKYYSNIVKFYYEPDNIFVLNNNDNKLLSKKTFPRWHPAFFELRKSIKKNKIRHVLVGQILPLGTAAWLLSMVMNFQYSVFIHGTDINYAQKNKRKKWLAKKILNSAEYIICNSSYAKNLTIKAIGKKENIKIVNPGVSYPARGQQVMMNKLQQKYNLKNKFILFSLGRLVKRKGIDKMLAAMSNIIENIPEAEYFIAGAGPDEAYLKEIYSRLNSKTRSKIKFLGCISDEEKWAWLKLSSIFVMPSRKVKGDVEGFGMVYLEANLCGKPIIAGQGGGAADSVIDYETGILVDPGSPDDIAESVMELYNKPMLRMELGENGMRRALEEFTPEKQARNIYNIICNL